METQLSLNSGQYVLYGFLLTSIIARRDAHNMLTRDESIELAQLVVDLTDLELYGDTTDCPDVMVMVNPEDAFGIFCEWYDENQTHFQEYLDESEI